MANPNCKAKLPKSNTKTRIQDGDSPDTIVRKLEEMGLTDKVHQAFRDKLKGCNWGAMLAFAGELYTHGGLYPANDLREFADGVTPIAHAMVPGAIQQGLVDELHAIIRAAQADEEPST